MLSRLVEMVNPAVVVALIIVGVLGVFLALLSVRVAWERNVLGLRRRWKRRQRRKRRQPPAYEPLQHDAPAEHPKPLA